MEPEAATPTASKVLADLKSSSSGIPEVFNMFNPMFFRDLLLWEIRPSSESTRCSPLEVRRMVRKRLSPRSAGLAQSWQCEASSLADEARCSVVACPLSQVIRSYICLQAVSHTSVCMDIYVCMYVYIYIYIYIYRYLCVICVYACAHAHSMSHADIFNRPCHQGTTWPGP